MAPITSSLDENLLPLRDFFNGQNIRNSLGGVTLWSEMNQNHTFHIPKKCKHNLTG
jgi:hypothetical protein